MTSEKQQISVLIAVAFFLGAVLLGYNVFYAPNLPLVNQVQTDVQQEQTETAQADAPVSTGKVNLNTATVQELCTLDGVGETTASHIITYRENNGKFETIQDLMQVDGIGEATFKKLQNQICV